MEQTSTLSRLREQLAARQLDGVIVPITNAFQGEYCPDSDKRLQWLTGFSGSNGMAIVLRERAAFFTDGRYTLQAAQEVNSDDYELINLGELPPHEWLKEHVEVGQVIAYDPWLHTRHQLQDFEKSAKEGGFELKATDNLIDPLWTDRPAAPNGPARLHPLKYAGVSATEKRQQIAEQLQKKRAEAAVLSAGDSICWLLNLRGSDVPYTPFILAYAILYADASVDLFFGPEKVDQETREALTEQVCVRPFSELERALAALAHKRVLIDPKRVSAWFFDRLEEANAEVMEAEDPCQLPKATKNKTEQEGARQAHIRDGVAVTNFLYWFEQNAPSGELTELDVAQKITEFRKEQALFQEPSFETISGYGPNGAVIHYRVTPATNRKIEPGSLHLIDSGGQYLDGTTDITRTLPVGTPAPHHKEHFTRVLKGTIQLAMAQFPEGTTGGQLDVLARHALWQVGLNYDHGTGHGLGSYLSVHEGPQVISSRTPGAKLAPGMLLSDEPGYYKAGEYGIRIENIIMVIDKGVLVEGEKRFFGFETLTLAPIDRRLIDPTLLTHSEKQWLNEYHQRVYKTLSPHLDEAPRNWLKEMTQPID